MGILVGMGWIIVGIVYVLYKLGSEEAGGGIAGGVLMVMLPLVVVLLMGGTAWVASQIAGDTGVGIWCLVLAVLLLVPKIKGMRH